MSNKKQLKISKVLQGIILCACLSIILMFSADTTAFAKIKESPKILLTAKTLNESDVLGYVGKVTGRVNVREKAGENSNRVLKNGEGVRLQRGENVLIIGEEMVGSKPWYQIKFEIDGEELTGYATSTYIEKTSTAITPEPSATTEPTATPEPSPTELPTVTPEPTSLPDGSSGQSGLENDSRIGTYIVVVLVSLLGLGVIGAAILHKKKDEAENSEVTLSEKLEKLKNLKLEKVTPSKENKSVTSNQKGKNHNKNRTKKSNINEDIKKNKESIVSEEFAATKEPIAEPRIAIVYTKNQQLEAKKESGSKESEEKKALRTDIEKLREHDIVIHKYFGRGEVFDNSDVYLIEVRFGGDVRFLNKETLVSKKLLTITNERNR